MPNYKSMNEVPDDILEKVGKYFTNVGGPTFAIVNLPPELTGGALARYSRAKTGMQLTLINEFIDGEGNPCQERGSDLMHRVLNQFGDDSVGELEGAHAGIEDVSQLMTKEIEDRRIGMSPIEQSTRYVKYDQKDEGGNWRYLRPEEIMESGHGALFESVNDFAFEVYAKGVEALSNYFKEQVPRDQFKIGVTRDGETIEKLESELSGDQEQKAFNMAYNFTVRCAALDVGRCVLPSSTLTHLGIFGNGRALSNLITHLKSNELIEAKNRGYDLEEELVKVIPTFIRRNHETNRFREINAAMEGVAKNVLVADAPDRDLVTLVRDEEWLDQVTSAALFPYTNISLQQIANQVRAMPEEQKVDILKTYRGIRNSRRDRTGRALEAGYPITFDLLGGFAEYRDLERHRMLTQQRQKLTTEHGFILPPEMIEVGLKDEVEEAIGKMEDLNSKLRHAGLSHAAQYATLFNHRIRFMQGMNLRAFQHLSELRTQPAGHFSYRAMVMEMADKLEERDPWTKEMLGFVDRSDPGNKISRAKEQSKIAGKNLKSGTVNEVDF